jgi:glycosyltransferase involved in cell wall biosynthesis
MRVSIIVSTYNSPEWLRHVLWAYAVQNHRNFELIVADDGSSFATALTIQRVRQEAGLPIRHIWHEHRGFRKCAIVNKAIVAASAEYLLFTDGDCIPRWDFVQQHVRLAERGRFLSGGAVRLPEAVSQLVTTRHILDRQVTEPKWLAARGLSFGKGCFRLAASRGIAWLCDHLTTTRATFNGGNSSAWKADILRVNGFDERMGYGGEDRELGERLANAGVRGKQIRHRAVCVHLDHGRGYVVPEVLERNLAIRNETVLERATWALSGIHKGFDSFEQFHWQTEAAPPNRSAA